MSSTRPLLTRVVIAALVLLLAPLAAQAQVTTGGITGLVVAAEDKAALPGAVVEAVHEPTGTRYSAVTRADGRFALLNVRVGGPYNVNVSMDGFRPQTQSDLIVQLGQDLYLDYQLQLETVSETLIITADSSPLINPYKTGASSQVSQEVIETLPTIDRGLEDFARTNPFFTVDTSGDANALSVAGRNTRYNSISIDGAVNNDLFGLADSGTPGGQSGTVPISLDAIQEVQLVLAPFDVRDGGFSGGGINAITRSGSNAFKGSVFYYTRDDGLVGDGPEGLGEFGTFEEDQYGFRLGGPISRDKVFFFVNAELEEASEPTGWSIDGSGGQAIAGGALVEEAQRFRDILISQYGFDPGGLGQQTRDNPSDKYFARLDFNINDRHNLTLRHNYVDAVADINFPGSFTFEFESETYEFASETNSTVAQLNSSFGNDLFNEARLSYQTIKDRRQGADGVRFPWIEIEDPLGDGSFDFEFEAGTEPFSTRNSLDQKVIEIHNDLTWLRGDHTWTFGTHNELFEFDNLFVQNAFGSYEFATLDDLAAGNARRFQHSFENPGQDAFARFGVDQIGLYVGDQWTKDNLTLNFGLRVDIPYFSETPGYNPLVDALYGVRTDEIPDGEQLWQPRFGFNWNPDGEGTAQLRGGVGVFAGRTPYVWISNQYTNNGLVFTSLTATGDVPFVTDPFNQPQTVPGASLATQEVNLVDPDFQFPQVLRYNLAYEYRLPWWDMVASAELLYSDSLEEIDYQNLNVRQTGRTTFDGRPEYERVSSDFNGAYYITNTSDGDATNFALKLERPYRNGFYGYVSYAWSESNVVNEGTSSRAVSNWRFQEAFDPNNAGVSTSDFEVEHRFNASLSYQFNRDTNYPTTVSLFYNLQSGRPFSWLMGSDFVTFGFGQSYNGDGFDSNDLFYVPATEADVEIVGGGTWEQLNAFINAHPSLNSSRGGIVGRNEAESPWNHTLDLHIAQAIPLAKTKLEITFDIFNLANLFDDDSGTLRFVNFASVEVAEVEGITDDGRPIYSLSNVVRNPDSQSIYTTDNVRSRWRAKLGLRWTF